MKAPEDMKSVLTATLLIVHSIAANAITLKEFRNNLNDDQRLGYLIALYDTHIIEADRLACMERIGYIGFIKLISNFSHRLPVDPNDKERVIFDSMNVALIAILSLDKECVRLGF